MNAAVASGATATKKAQILNAAATTVPTAIENPRTSSFMTHLPEQDADSDIHRPVNADGSHPRVCRARVYQGRNRRHPTASTIQIIQRKPPKSSCFVRIP